MAYSGIYIQKKSIFIKETINEKKKKSLLLHRKSLLVVEMLYSLKPYEVVTFMIKKPRIQMANYIVGFSPTMTYSCKLLGCLRPAK